jgi:uncharacterized protein DUF6885
MAPQLAATHKQQKDNLCGPFCAARILGVDQDLVALRAGTALPVAPAEPSVPRGAESLTDYAYELPNVPNAESGTSAAGLAEAIESLSNGSLRCVPVRGQWSADRVAAFVEGAPPLGARLIANIRTGKLWGSRPSAEQLLAELRGVRTEGPPADWDVGHFVELKVLVRVIGGSLVVVHDTYPMFGLDGHHLQPPRAVAAALMRGDGREGGILAVMPPDKAAAVAELARGLGLQIGTWNNGSRSERHGDR